MNAATAIYVWYLTPLMLATSGFGPAEIARAVMLYYLAIVLLSPTIAQLSDGRLGPAALVLAGSAASGLALLSAGFWDGSWAVTVAVAGLGVSHGLIRAPHYALALRLSQGSDNISLLRLVERASALLGLSLSALFLADIGAETTVTVLAAFVLSGAAVFAIVQVFDRPAQTGAT